MPYFLLVQTCENFGALQYMESKSKIYYQTMQWYDVRPNMKFYALDVNAIKKLFNDQIDAIQEWQKRGFKDVCPVFLPYNFTECVCQCSHRETPTT